VVPKPRFCWKWSHTLRRRGYKQQHSLSDRDKLILKLLAEGLTQREAGERFGISDSTVQVAIKRIDERGFGEVLYVKEEANRK
jgi:DNA-binding CsgD family transcriptional regulator